MAVEPGEQGQFAPIRLENRSASIALEIGALRIDHYRLTVAHGSGDNPLDYGSDRKAFGVVRYQDGIHARHQTRGALDHLIGQAGVDRRCIFLVDANDLLVMRHDAQFHRGGAPRDDREARAIDAALGQHSAQLRARFVLACDAEESHARAQRRHIACGIRRAAWNAERADLAHDGHRRLGRDAIHVARPIAVQHQIAGDQHTPAGKCGDSPGDGGVWPHAGDGSRKAGDRRQKSEVRIPPSVFCILISAFALRSVHCRPDL
jgi:hypothetical protein